MRDELRDMFGRVIDVVALIVAVCLVVAFAFAIAAILVS